MSRIQGMDYRLIAIAEDKAAYDYLSLQTERVYSVIKGDAGPPLAGALGFESNGFASLMSRRASHLLAQLLRLTSTDSILVFSDLDVIWIRDPRPFFVQGCDAWAQTQHRERKLLNPGFLALSRTDGSLLLLGEWERRLLRGRPQRNLPVFNQVVNEFQEDVKVCALRPELFLSAKRSFGRRKWSPKVDARAVVAHANWIDGHDAKRAAFLNAGAWIISDNVKPVLIPSNNETATKTSRSPHSINLRA